VGGGDDVFIERSGDDIDIDIDRSDAVAVVLRSSSMSSSSMVTSNAGRRGGVLLLFSGTYFFFLFVAEPAVPFCHRLRMPADACARCWRKEDALRCLLVGLATLGLGLGFMPPGSESAHDVPVLVRDEAVGARYPGNLPPPGSGLVLSLRGMVGVWYY